MKPACLAAGGAADYLPDMTALDIIRDLQSLPLDERAKVRLWLDEQIEETPALLAAIDEGLRSLEECRATAYTREELSAKVALWAGKSR